MAIARMNSEKAVSVPEYTPPTCVHVNLKKFKSLDSYNVWDTVNCMMKCKITSIRKDKETSTMDMDVMDMSEEEDD